MQECCEVVVLLLIVAVVGSACADCIISSLLDATSAAVAPSRQLRRQIVGTAWFVFVTYLLRALCSTMIALVNQLQDEASPDSCRSNKRCDLECTSCGCSSLPSCHWPSCQYRHPLSHLLPSGACHASALCSSCGRARGSQM